MKISNRTKYMLDTEDNEITNMKIAYHIINIVLYIAILGTQTVVLFMGILENSGSVTGAIIVTIGIVLMTSALFGLYLIVPFIIYFIIKYGGIAAYIVYLLFFIGYLAGDVNFISEYGVGYTFGIATLLTLWGALNFYLSNKYEDICMEPLMDDF